MNTTMHILKNDISVHSQVLLSKIQELIDKHWWKSFEFDMIQKEVAQRNSLVSGHGFDGFHSTDFRQKDFQELVDGWYIILLESGKYSIAPQSHEVKKAIQEGAYEVHTII